MKKTTLAIAMAALALMAGCKKENTNGSIDMDGATLTAAIEQHKADGSKTSLNPDDLSISWTTGDAIFVNNGTESKQFTLGSIDSEGVGVFGCSGDYTFGTSNIAVYPYNENTTISNGTVTMTLPETQTATAGTFGNGANPMLDTFSDPERATFTSLCGALCLQLKGNNVHMTAIEVVNGTDGMLNGTYTFDAASPTLANPTEGTNKVRVELSQPVTLTSTAATKFFVVLPACTMTNGLILNVYDGESKIFTKKANTEIAIAVNTVSTMGELQVIAGALNSAFSVSATQQVYFSNGNLQYQATTNTWRLAMHQYDYVGSANSNLSETYSGWIDFFGWGTSGYNHNNAKYHPWDYGTDKSQFYAYGDANKNLYDEDGKADWGYNSISNGGNQENSGWRTLTIDELYYLFDTRTTSSGIRWTRANVGNVNGIILLPDNWSMDYYTLNNANGGSYAGDTITAEDWANKLEANGAAFLPAAGYRNDANTNVNAPGSGGSYRSATHGTSLARGLYFANNQFQLQGGHRFGGGSSVRLVRNVE